MPIHSPATPALLRSPASAEGGGSSDEVAIRALLAAYNAALNAGDTAAIMPLYAEDGVFMAPFDQSAIGQDEVRRAYDKVFAELTFDVRFDIAEVMSMGSGWAFVRTNSAGTTAHASTGKTTSEANQELFILRVGADERWSIARYSFSATNAPGTGA